MKPILLLSNFCFLIPFGIISVFSKRKEATIPDINLENVPLEEKSEIIERPQQSFAFDEQLTPSKEIAQPRSKYKLPAIDYLEKNNLGERKTNF